MTTDDVRCSTCATLLAKFGPEGVIRVRYKMIEASIFGVLLIVCRGCGRLKTIRSRERDCVG